jgi:hypothetical protein
MPRGHYLTEAVKDAIRELQAEGGSEAEIGRRPETVSMAIGFSPTAARKFPTGGHLFSPLVAIRSLRWWPSFLPTRGGPRGRVRGLTPLPGGRLGEPVAVLTVGDHQGNATLNYRSVLAWELTAEDAELYRRSGYRRRLRRVSAAGEGPESV